MINQWVTIILCEELIDEVSQKLLDFCAGKEWTDLNTLYQDIRKFWQSFPVDPKFQRVQHALETKFDIRLNGRYYVHTIHFGTIYDNV